MEQGGAKAVRRRAMTARIAELEKLAMVLDKE